MLHPENGIRVDVLLPEPYYGTFYEIGHEWIHESANPDVSRARSILIRSKLSQAEFKEKFPNE